MITTKTWLNTVATEGRSPDNVYQVTIKNDNTFDAAAGKSRNSSSWFVFPNGEKSTNCSQAANGALRAGGVRGIFSRSSAWPNWMNSDKLRSSLFLNQVYGSTSALW